MSILGNAESKQKRQVAGEFTSIPCMRHKENGAVTTKQAAVFATIRNDILSNT